MRQLALNISKKFVDRQIIPEEDIEIYRYGLEILISSSFTSISVVLVATLLDSFGYGLLYLLLTAPLRVTVGGYHADTYKKCFLVSNLSYAALSFSLKLLICCNIPIYIWLVILYMSAFYIFSKAPVQNVHHPLTETSIKRNKRLATIYLFFDILIITFLAITHPTAKIIYFSILSVLLVALLIIPTQKKGGCS